jgi:hypothetical protein
MEYWSNGLLEERKWPKVGAKGHSEKKERVMLIKLRDSAPCSKGEP